MGKDTRLVNIYLKIHNKRPITMDDLRYLAEYSPECFEKTCKNVIYNRPETKPVMTPAAPTTPNHPWTPLATASGSLEDTTVGKTLDLMAEYTAPPTEQENITQILANLSQLESGSFPITYMDAGEVKDLLGNLYMELLFPHNDRDTFFDMGYAMGYEPSPQFDCKA